MNPFVAIFAKIFLLLTYKKDEYLFWRSQKYIQAWGTGSYGLPTIVSYDKKSTVSVGKYVSIASGTSILLGANHKPGLITTFPINLMVEGKTTEDSNEPGNVIIGNDVWIGYGVTILSNITIGDGAIIGAEALVVDDVPPYAVIGGVPAKVIKYRFDEETIKKLQQIAWWNWDTYLIKNRAEDIYNENPKIFIDKYTPKF